MKISELFEAYSEPNSTFTHEGKRYSLTDLLNDTDTLPIKQFNVDNLKWILEYDTPDPVRVASANLTAPILITMSNNRPVVIDGLHRLAKAVAQGQKTIPGKLVAEDMLDKHQES